MTEGLVTIDNETNVVKMQQLSDTFSRLKTKQTVIDKAELFYAEDIDRMLIGNGTTQGQNRPVFLDSAHEAFISVIDGILKSRDLTQVHSAEIASGTTRAGRSFTANDEWAWISARRIDGDYDGIHLWDYIPIARKAGTVGEDTYTAATINAYIIDIDSDYYYGDDGHVVGHHIDFMIPVIGKNVKWQITDNNNATADQNIVWLTTNLYAYLNGVNNYTTNAYNSVAHGADYSSGGYVDLMPDKLQAVLREFRMYLPKRYSANGLITAANAGGWCDAGKMRTFSEIELYGSAISSYSQNTADGGINFDNIGAPRQKAGFRFINPHKLWGRTNVWTLSGATGVSNRACYLSYDGGAYTHYCTYTWYSSPAAFRV